jgi:POT family proton-dependent oligopeptide transporter
VTPLRRIGIGFFVAVLPVVIVAWFETLIASGESPHVLWQIVPYIFLTAAEIMISITMLEFSYTQAPKAMKSFITSFYLLSISLGNALAAAINFAIANERPIFRDLKGANYYWFFAGLVLGAALLFAILASYYRGKTQLQTDDDDGEEE